MIRLALILLTPAFSAGSIAAMLAPAPFPRDRKRDKAEGNEANVKKLQEAVRQRRSDKVTIVLAVEERWKIPRLIPEGSFPRRVRVSEDDGAGFAHETGANDEWVMCGSKEGQSSLTVTFDQDADSEKPFTVVIQFLFVKRTK
jgi:hypothetical protein